MASTPIETLLEGKGFSCDAGGNWTSGKGQGIGCVALGACDFCTSVLPPHRGGAVPSPMGMGRNGRTDLRRGSTKRSPPLSCLGLNLSRG